MQDNKVEIDIKHDKVKKDQNELDQQKLSRVYTEDC